MNLGGFHTIETPDDAIMISERVSTTHTILLEEVAGSRQALLAASRLLVTDVFHAFGRAEVNALCEDGTLRYRHVFGFQNPRQWAEQNGVAVTEATVT